MKSMYYLLILYSIVITMIYLYHKVRETLDYDRVVVKVVHKGRLFEYDRDSPLIFIGGFVKSGTTLLRSMIEAHPSVSCGEETVMIPKLLTLTVLQWQTGALKSWLAVAGITESLTDESVARFILTIMARHEVPAPRLCNKDPYVLNFTEYTALRLFPNAKFLLMLRDGRSIIHSLIRRHMPLAYLNYNATDYEEGLIKWDRLVASMYGQCMSVGPKRCMPIYYESLVNEPEVWMRRIAKFVDLPFHESMLHHQKLVGEKITVYAFFDENITEPITNKSICMWPGHIPKHVMDRIDVLAPMLTHLGYDTQSERPNFQALLHQQHPWKI